MASTVAYPWWETTADDSLEQGDFLRDFEVAVPRRSTDGLEGTIEVEIQTFDLIVMTQTCDIAQNRVRSLLLCPWWDLWQFVETSKAKGENWGRDLREALRRGNLPGYHLLNDATQDGLVIDVGVVDFHEVYTAPTEQVREFVNHQGPRLRLCPPYREHLAQAFARFFMRVGLPVDIPKDKLRQVP